MPHSRQIREIRQIGRGRYQVICESDPPFVLYEKELKTYGITEESECSAETYARICDEVFRRRAWNRCMYLLEKQDYTEEQIRRKLRDGYYPEEIIEETLSRLRDTGAVNDRRYAENYLQMNRGRYSRRMLEQKLLQRGIRRELITQVWEAEPSCAPDEAEQIRRQLQKKQYDPSSVTQEEREKIRRSLLQKGFSYDQIIKLT